MNQCVLYHWKYVFSLGKHQPILCILRSKWQYCFYLLSIGSTIGHESTRFESGKPRKQTKQGVYSSGSWQYWNSSN